jgi:cation diffusion facilitator CzcD-associated flavoprotein CzcO
VPSPAEGLDSKVDSLAIGAGQAGLATSYWLARRWLARNVVLANAAY